MKSYNFFIMVLMLVCVVACRGPEKRTAISLDGTWKIAEGSMTAATGEFDHNVPVPGLVTLATPPFREAGPKVKERYNLIQKDTLREAFWYKRQFRINGKIPENAMLKVSKAMFGTKMFLNGVDLGEHLPSFTPGWFDVKKALKTGDNEIMIRVGSCRNSLPGSIPDGFDFEKERYIPGIFDHVDLIMCGMPLIRNVQTSPDITGQSVKVQVRLKMPERMTNSKIRFEVTEEKSGKETGALIKEFRLPASSGYEAIVSVSIPLKECKLWSPEDPFLYRLKVITEGDEFLTRFGMRDFRLDTLTGRITLNGEPYFMRGSNITLYRFFEDDSCRNLPWNESWVRKLHKSFKQFHWNGVRYCIGLAPDDWYNIADEEGILIQNEFPVWYGGKGWCVWPKELRSPELAKEYTEWIEEQWNHPSIVIWDASNETLSDEGKTEEVADAIKQVRMLDKSNRPWDNSYSDVRSAGDVMELHPYHFNNPKFRLEDLAKTDPNPGGGKDEKKYIKIVNEYGWLWLNRDGSPTTLTKDLYRNLLGADSSVARRREIYAEYLAAETEFWRCHRECAAVLHFTALGYSRRDGQTSDHFLDVANLVYDKEFMKYMPDAFSPVGLMLDEWGDAIPAGSTHEFRILAINDLAKEWRGKISLRVYDDNKAVAENNTDAVIQGYGQTTVHLSLKMPILSGKYRVVASLEKDNEAPIKSVREIPTQ